MQAASLYCRSNYVQRRDAKEVVKEYSKILQWRYDGEDTLMDIGCGSGDVLIDYILPIMPKKFKKLTGIDISENMIKYAKNYYKNIKNVEFNVLDIENDLNEIYYDQYDHITSFYCWHWIQNQRKALQNVYNILHEDGDCLITFLAYNPVYDIYNDLSMNPKWCKYMTDVHKFISPFQYKENPDQDFRLLLKSIGFQTIQIEMKNLLFVYEGLENLKRNNKAVNPFVNRLPVNLQDEFMNDYIRGVISKGFSQKNGDDFIFPTPYKLVVAYARK
ncbi:juvenile hormone acid O-methyltransferase [Condylostylus longicornis]|uniref:juvenile hormone acid O-methyltransferase n=1 Tax=Condylostylus longicornis TaxID=2530218 RepID=UPI00244E33D4|nr:juvenile hormone acid O-methyltransferase [Condylostylus longicornis]